MEKTITFWYPKSKGSVLFTCPYDSLLQVEQQSTLKMHFTDYFLVEQNISTVLFQPSLKPREKCTSVGVSLELRH